MFAACFLTALAVLGFVFNTITILTFNKNRDLLTVQDLPVLSIAIADVVLAAIVAPFGAAAQFLSAWPFGSGGCSWYACVSAIIGLGTMLHHTVLAVEKCWKIHHPMTTDVTHKQMLKVIVFLWIFTGLWGILPLIGWSSYGPEGTGASCSIKWQSDDLVDTSFIICIFVIFFLFPVVSIVVSYAIIYKDLQQMVKRAQSNWNNEGRQTLQVVLARKRAVLTGFTMITSFVVVWTPYAIVSFYAAFGKPQSIPPLAATIPALCAKTSILLNPIIYAIRYKRFREGIKKLFKMTKFPNNSV